MNLRRFLVVAAGVALGLVFVVAATSKIMDSGMSRDGPQSGLALFASQLRQQGVFPQGAIDPAARAVVFLELVIGAWLLLHLRIAAALWTAVALLSGLSVYLMILLASSGDQECACFGTQSHQLASAGLWKNVLLTGVAALGLMALPRAEKPRMVASTTV